MYSGEVSRKEIELAINQAQGDLEKAAALLEMNYSDLAREVINSDYLQKIAEEAKHVRARPKTLKDVRPKAEQPIPPAPRKEDNSRILVISDTHAPYHHPDTIPFLHALNAKHKFTRIIHIGDEVDNHAMSFHDSDPDLPSAGNELHQARIFLHELERIFPDMDIVKSNHGDLYERKARAGGIPAEAIVPRATLYRVGGGWHFHDDIILKLPTGYDCMFVHGRAKNVLNASKAVSMSFVQGHFHTEFGIKYWRTPHALHFGMAVGCLIDRKSLAMHYAKDNREEQLIGCGMILEGMPCLAPMFLDKDGNWTGLRP